jgi:hypothetical protein
MMRIAAVLIAAGLSAWPTPAPAQEALRTFGSGHVLHADRTPSLLGPFSDASRAVGLTVDRRALRAVPAATSRRLAWSTAPIAGLPARVSWNRSHTALASTFLVGLLIDAAQTRELARHGWAGYREANPLLGDRPGVGRVNTYTAVVGLGVLGAAAAVPPRVRPWLLGAAIAIEAFTVGSSVRQGLPIRFP